MTDLTDVHQAQIARFMGFFKNKREALQHDRQTHNRQFIDDYLSDDTAIFNRDNVEGIVVQYQQTATDNLNEELTKLTTMAAAYCAELMRVGQAMGINLQTEDISVVEDQGRMDNVSQVSRSSITRTSMSMPLAAPKNQLLPSMGGSAQDPALLQQLQDAQEETKKMNQRYGAMQEQVTTLLQERSSLSAELNTVRENFTALRSTMAASNADAASQQTAYEMECRLNQSQTAIAAKSQELEAMRRDVEGRLGDSAQFRQLKSIIKDKNSQIKTLRGQLQAAGYAVPDEGVELTADSD